jgi:CheY-like chemotaxis protein
MGNIALAADRESAQADPRLGRYLDQAMLSSKKARDLVRQMLTYSRGLRGERRHASLPNLMRQATRLLRSSLPATVEIVTDVEDDSLGAMVDAVQVEQVLLNLGINARDAMRSAGTIRMGVFRRERFKGTCASCRQKFEGDFVELLVADNGPGIPSQVLERMFEPYFTTKGPGEGSGLGLSTVHGAVHDHQGHIVVETARDRGASFRVYIPASASPETPKPQFMTSGRWSAIPQARLSGHILLVDDEEAVLTVMRELLEGWGLTVTAASNGRSALASFESEPARFDAIITDQTMPHLTGIELARQAAAIRPGLPIVLCTGYGGSIAQGRLDEAGVRALLAKPVEPRELLVTVETCLRPAKMVEGLER